MTLSGNSASSSNGGALQVTAGSAALQNVTVVANSAGGSSGGGAFRFLGGSVTVMNTLLAHNTGSLGAPSNCSGGTPTSLGHNIADLADCSLTGAGDISSTDPLTAALADNGGPVQTAALQAGSAAIDGGAGCAATDARGVARPQGPACDIGAFELVPPPPTFTLTLAVTGSGGVTSSPAGISCPSTCSAGFASGTGVTLTATPATGNTFAGWSGACSGTGACIVSITAATAVGAAFSATPPASGSTPTTPTQPAPFEPPRATIAFVPTAPVPGQKIAFAASVDGPGAVTYRWDLGDGGAEKGPAVVHAYGSPGTYLVTVTVTDSFGATGTVQTKVVVAGSTPTGPGRVFGGRVMLWSSFGPGEKDPGLPAPAGLAVSLLNPVVAGRPTGGLQTTTTLGGLYQVSQLPAAFSVASVAVFTAVGRNALGESDEGSTVPLLPLGSPAIGVRDFSVVPDANSLTVSGRVLAPATGTAPPDLVVSVSVDAYDLGDRLILSGAVKSNGFGSYRVEATPTAAFTTNSGRANAIARLVVKLSENGVVIDTTDSRNRLTIGHNYPTRDLHGA